MAKSAIQTLTTPQERALEASRQVALVVGASLIVALCAKITIPLMPLTPVPLTVQNLGVLLVGLLLGSRRGFAALALYLAEGAMGLPVFSPASGGIAQLFGPTGGFLMAYPFVAFLAGYIFERGAKYVCAGGRSPDCSPRSCSSPVDLDAASICTAFSGQGRLLRPVLVSSPRKLSRSWLPRRSPAVGGAFSNSSGIRL